MLFTDSIFLFYFLPISLLLLRFTNSLSEGKGFNNYSRLLLFILTAIFYGIREPWWLVPFFLCIGFDFLWASLLVRTSRPGWRRLWLACSVLQNLGLLAVFKYWDFVFRLVERMAPSIAPFFPQVSLGGSHTFLPPGISFYTFESLSFVIDVYRRQVSPPKSALEFFAFIGMFPRFIAGPIVRYRDMVSQFGNYSGMRLESGLFLFVFGLFLKCGFADNFEPFVEYAFLDYRKADFFGAWLGALAYTMQIYFDFSGYSLMAMGLGRCLGFEFPKNFNRPYLATSLQDFWRRWHISLSTWLRDYLYIPLGGNRKSALRTHLNLLITMALGGLWHGARGNFVCWGVWHGLFLCVERIFNLEERLPARLHRLVTFIVVVVGWVFFRATNGTTEAIHILKIMASPWTLALPLNLEALVLSPLSVALCAMGVLYCFVIERKWDVIEVVERAPLALVHKIMGIAMFLSALLLALSSRLVPFLYFQF